MKDSLSTPFLAHLGFQAASFATMPEIAQRTMEFVDVYITTLQPLCQLLLQINSNMVRKLYDFCADPLSSHLSKSPLAHDPTTTCALVPVDADESEDAAVAVSQWGERLRLAG